MTSSGRTCVADADATITALSAGLLSGLRTLAKQGRLKYPSKVFKELRPRTKKTATLKSWEEKYQIVITLDITALALLRDIEQKYGPPFVVGGTKTVAGLWNSPNPSKAGDSQLVALAKSRGWTVVSNDESVRAACFLENVDCFDWWELAREIQALK